MKIFMDADCLIKLTKAELKEIMSHVYSITIPHVVKVESSANSSRYPDAASIADNIEGGRVSVYSTEKEYETGDDALLYEFSNTKCDVVGTDDRQLIRRLQTRGIPYITPGVCVFLLKNLSSTPARTAIRYLEKLKPYISEDEYVIVKILIEGGT